MLSIHFAKRCLRILHIAKKPTKKELDAILKITGLGVLAIGVFGMLMYLIFNII
ncbi:protein translocase SEC61 complex subunit gamma [Candidatus Micrarchaeota archaeon]|nr:protein translocase SEC61 complex subunit gamma [Candidatus Micrarchaeota archaeon]